MKEFSRSDVNKLNELFLDKEFNSLDFDKLIKERLDGRKYEISKWYLSPSISFNYKHKTVILKLNDGDDPLGDFTIKDMIVK